MEDFLAYESTKREDPSRSIPFFFMFYYLLHDIPYSLNVSLCLCIIRRNNPFSTSFDYLNSNDLKTSRFITWTIDACDGLTLTELDNAQSLETATTSVWRIRNVHGI